MLIGFIVMVFFIKCFDINKVGFFLQIDEFVKKLFDQEP